MNLSGESSNLGAKVKVVENARRKLEATGYQEVPEGLCKKECGWGNSRDKFLWVFNSTITSTMLVIL